MSANFRAAEGLCNIEHTSSDWPDYVVKHDQGILFLRDLAYRRFKSGFARFLARYSLGQQSSLYLSWGPNNAARH